MYHGTVAKYAFVTKTFEAYTAYMLRMFHKVAAKILILQ
ncbi:MAG: hypothetical protein UX17_C0005G0005 [Parcubacteria group bacterium GW2011_GWC2_45_7]|nr:MAG: hypothetical protein UX17_C0005G0005 [Parcubacteria group bacterium GW2011_GWC2_45_7]